MAAFGRPLPPAEFVPYLFTCLGLNYDALVSFVTTQLEPISPMELLGHLLAHEAHLLHHLDMCTFPMEAFANLTTNSSLTSIGRGPRSGQSSYMDAMVVVFNHIVVVLALQVTLVNIPFLLLISIWFVKFAITKATMPLLAFTDSTKPIVLPHPFLQVFP